MSRKGQIRVREVPADPKYHDRTVAKFMNVVMERGKKSLASKILDHALDSAAERSKEQRPVQARARQRPPGSRGSLAPGQRRQLPGAERGPSRAAQLARDALAGFGGALAWREVDGRTAGCGNPRRGCQSRRRGQEARRHTSNGGCQQGVRPLPLVITEFFRWLVRHQ